MNKEAANMKEIKLFSNRDCFPIRIKFMDKNNTISNYILFKTGNDKLILQKPLLYHSYER